MFDTLKSPLASYPPPPGLLRPSNHAHCLPFPLTLCITKVASNELGILLKCSLVPTGIHPLHDGLANEGNMLHPGVIPLRWRARLRHERILRRCAWQLDVRVFGHHPVWT